MSPTIIHQSKNSAGKRVARAIFIAHWFGGGQRKVKDNAKVLCHLGAARPFAAFNNCPNPYKIEGVYECVSHVACVMATLQPLIFCCYWHAAITTKTSDQKTSEQKDSQLGFLKCPIFTKNFHLFFVLPNGCFCEPTLDDLPGGHGWLRRPLSGKQTPKTTAITRLERRHSHGSSGGSMPTATPTPTRTAHSTGYFDPAPARGRPDKVSFAQAGRVARGFMYWRHVSGHGFIRRIYSQSLGQGCDLWEACHYLIAIIDK